jgi:hypothetical protein
MLRVLVAGTRVARSPHNAIRELRGQALRHSSRALPRKCHPTQLEPLTPDAVS